MTDIDIMTTSIVIYNISLLFSYEPKQVKEIRYSSCQHCGQKISDSYNILNDLSFIDSKCLQSIYHEHSNEQDEDTRAVYQYLLNQVMYCSNCKNTMSNNNWDAKGCSVNPICLNCKIY